MKKILAIMVSCCFLLTACGSDLEVNGKTYGTYGVLNQDSNKNPNLKYEIILGNVVWGIITFETIIGAVYFFGFSLYQPVSVKNCYEPGLITQQKCQ